jgi:hypothetical protein
MKCMRTAAAAALAISIALEPTLARAQGASSQAAAEALFDEGKRLMAAGDFAHACGKLAESQRLDPGAGTLLNLGACYERNGQTATAWVTYKDAIIAADRSGRKEWASAATKRARALEPNLSKVVISVPEASKSAGLTIKRDGAVVNAAEWGVAIPLDPGLHVVEATAPDKKPASFNIKLEAKADVHTVTIPVLDAVAQVASETKPTKPMEPVQRLPAAESGRTEPSGTTRYVGLGLVGAGIVAIGVGTVFGLRASGLADDAKANCNPDQSRCNPAGLGQVDDAHSAATVSTIAFVAGAALVAGGAVLYLTSPKGGQTTGQRTTVAPTFGSAAGLSMQGSF